MTREALAAAEQNGIVFLDEIDKISAREGRIGADVSREGVQRDLLPLIEGTTVSTKHGPVKTDHILFIASGAFHVAKPSDLLPELQGRLPIRVELQPLSREDLARILTEPEASLIKQYKALMATEGMTLEFTDDAIDEIAKLAARGQQPGREHRRAAAADRDGEAARGDELHGLRPRRRDGGRSTRPMSRRQVGGPRRQRRPEQVHPLSRRLAGSIGTGRCAAARSIASAAGAGAAIR